MDRARYQFGSLTQEAGEGIRRLGVSLLRVHREGLRLRKTATVGTVDKYKKRPSKLISSNSTLKGHSIISDP